MKNRSSKNAQYLNQNVYPVQVAGMPRACPCGTTVRRGIMWEFKTTLHCSKLCATEAEKAFEATQLAETVTGQ